MTANVQGSASSIGTAPVNAPAAQQAGGLPSLTQQMGGAPTGTQAPGSPATPGQGTATAPGAVAAAPFDMNKIASQGRWLGPLLTVGGGIAAIAAFAKGQNGSKFLKFAGPATALGGVGLTMMGYKAKGIEDGTKATEATAVQAITELSTQFEAQLQQQAAASNQQITALQQQVALAQQQTGAGQGTPGAADPNAPGVQDPNATPGMPTPGVNAGEETGSSTPVGPGASIAVVPTNDGYTNVPTTSGSGWSVTSVMGKTTQLQAGISASGTQIAKGGSFRIEQPAGDPNGYATLAEANDAARRSMSTELSGSSYLRWMVLEHEGRFYGAIAKEAQPGEQTTPLTQDLGTVVAWSALNHVTENGGKSGFQAYTWNAVDGAQAIPVAYGTTSVFPSGTGAAPTGTTGTAPAGQQQPGVTGGGAVVAPTTPAPAQQFDPASQIGRSFAINASVTAEGDVVRGGSLQIQKFVEASAGGFGTAEEAATVARAARTAAGGDQWSRFVTLQGADNRFYIYQGSIVARETAALQNAAPMHVFGAGFSAYFDGASSAWKALRDA